MNKNSNIQNGSDKVSVVENSSKDVVDEDIIEEDDKRGDWDDYNNFEELNYVDNNFEYDINMEENDYMSRQIYSKEQYNYNTNEDKIELLKNVL